MPLSNETLVVAGGTSGIGAGGRIAAAVRVGACVVLVGRDPDLLDAAVKQLRTAHPGEEDAVTGVARVASSCLPAGGSLTPSSGTLVVKRQPGMTA